MIFSPKTALSLFLCDFCTFYFHFTFIWVVLMLDDIWPPNQMGKLKE